MDNNMVFSNRLGKYHFVDIVVNHLPNYNSM
jgi:hypothetical protein